MLRYDGDTKISPRMAYLMGSSVNEMFSFIEKYKNE
jgi:hypothetical protein